MPEEKQRTGAPDIREIMADYDKAIRFLSETPAEVWESLGDKTALSVFSETAKNVSAYEEFLRLQKADPSKVKTMDDFYALPITDKYNYIQPYGFNEVNTDKAGENLYSFSLSSGTVDEPTIWPRYYQYEEFLPLVFDVFMRLYWQTDKKSTLVINAYAMGPWIAGMIVNAALRPLTQRYNLTLATTGADADSIIYSVVKLAKHYDQVVIFSYPTFARTILDKLQDAGVKLADLNLKMFIGGEGHTVEWRQYINKLTKGNPKDVVSIIDGYGTTDAGLAGMGSALTNLVRDLAFKDKELCEDLFGRGNSIPALFQYNPSVYFIEEYNGDILFTTKSTTPLVRYNLRDRGGVIRFRDMEQILDKHGYDYRKILKRMGLPKEIVWQQPFVYCFGRRDDTVIIGGANVYPEQIAPALFNEKVKDVHSFKLKTTYDKEQHQLFYILLELRVNVSYDRRKLVNMKKKYHDLIIDRLSKVSSDYAVSYKADPKYADINVEIFNNGEGPFEEDKSRTKPRLIVR